jgi:hypothetical protein
MKDTASQHGDLVQRLRASRALKDAPEPLIVEIIALWDQRRTRQGVSAAPAAGAIRRVFSALLRFDSALQPSAFAAARAQDEDLRQLVFSIEGREVDLRIRRSRVGTTPAWIVSGQVLGPDRAGLTCVDCAAFHAEQPWSEFCEFHLEPVPACEACVVTLRAEDWEAVLPAFALPFVP